MGLWFYGRLFRDRTHADLTCAGKDRVFEIGAGRLSDRRGDPLAVWCSVLPEDARPHAIGAQIETEDENVKLEALVRTVGRAVPLGNDGPAERIGRRERHERH